MSNQSQRDAIRAYMREHDVNYTTARRAILGNTVEVTPQTDDLSGAAHRLRGEFIKPPASWSLATNGFYDPLAFVESPTFVDLGCDDEPSEHVLDALRDLGAIAVTPVPDGGTVAPIGFEIEFADLPQDEHALRETVQDRLDAMATDHDWYYVWEAGTLRAAAAAPLPLLAPFPDEGSPKCEAWHEQFRRGVIGVGPAKGGGIAAIDLTRSPHVLLGGYAGAGKTNLTNLIVYGVVSNPDHVEAVLVDINGVEYGWVPDHAENLSGINGGKAGATLVQARDALAEAYKEVQRRQRLLRKHRAENLASLRMRGGSEIPRRRLVILDDASALFTPYKDPAWAAVQNEARRFAEQIALKGRATEINLVALAQRPSHENLGTALRAQFTNRIAIGRMSRALSILGCDSTLPEDAPKGRARFVTDDGAPVEVQLYAMPERDLVEPKSGEMLAQGLLRRRRGVAERL